MEEGGPALPPAVPAAASTTSEKKNDDDSELKNTAKAKTKVDEVDSEDGNESGASSSEEEKEEEELEGVSAYERLRLERIQRNEARLKDLGLLDTKIGNKKKKKSGGKRKASQRPKNVPGAPPTREQPKRNKSRKSQLPEAAAASPKHHVNQIPKNSLKTSKTPSSSKPTKKRCGECEGCLLAMTSANEDCMACTNCLERLRSPVRGRRRCLFKQCRQRYVRLQKEIEKQQKQQQQEAQLKKDGAENENNTKSRDPAATTPSSTISQPNPEEVPSNCNTKDDGVATAIEKSVVEGKEETASLSGIKQEKEVEPQEEKKEEMEQHLAPSSPTIPANTKDDVQGSDDNTVPIPVPNSIASSCTKQETYETKAPGSAPAIASEEASTLVTKQDQTNYETVLQEPQQPQEEQELPPPPPRPTSCNICQLPTPSYFLVACSNCNKGYHSSCHVPKIRTLEDGWLCMDCIPKSTKQLPIEHGDGDDFPLGKGWLWGTTFGADLGIQPPPSVAKKRKKKKSTSARFTPSKRKQQQKRAVQEEPEPPSVLLNKLIKVKILDPSPVCLMCDEMICPSLGTSTSNDEANNESMLSIQCKACDEYYHWSCHHQMEKEGQELELKKKKKKIEESTEEGVGIAEKQEENLDNEGGRGDVKMAEPVDEANAVEAISEEEDVIATFPKGKRLALWKCYTCIRDSKELLPHHHPDNKKKRKRDRESIKKDQEKEAAKNGDDDDPLGKLQLFKGEPDDDCYICLNGGDLVCCDFCPKVFHLGCHVPKLPAFPTGIWKCCECYATDLQAQGGEMTRCGECSACMIKPCGECKACTNKKENECERKPECPNRSFAPTYEPGKIPGEIFTQQEIDELQNKRKKKKRSKKRKKVEPVEEVRYFDPNEESGDENAGDKGNQDCDLGRVVKLPIPKLKDTESVQIHKIMKAARKSPMDSKVQDKACEQLRKLVTPSLSPSECCVKIILAGGIELISKAMSQHPDKSILQAEASATISELVWAKPELAIKLAHMGIVQQIIRGMESFPVHPKVKHFGCSAFRSLSDEVSNIVVINNGYGITATLNSIKRNPKKLGVQKEACSKYYVVASLLGMKLYRKKI